MGENTMIPEIVTKDDHPIASLVIDYNQRVADWQPSVGKDGVTSLEPYNEFGQGEYCLWFAIITEEGVGWRVNGRYVVEIIYGTD